MRSLNPGSAGRDGFVSARSGPAPEKSPSPAVARLARAAPALAVAAIALVAVEAAKLFTAKFKTRCLKNLQEEFVHWHGVREEALKAGSQDGEKGRLLRIC